MKNKITNCENFDDVTRVAPAGEFKTQTPRDAKFQESRHGAICQTSKADIYPVGLNTLDTAVANNCEAGYGDISPSRVQINKQIIDYKKKINKINKEIDERMKVNPLTYVDKECEELVLLKAELKGFEKAMEEVKKAIEEIHINKDNKYKQSDWYYELIKLLGIEGEK